MLTQLNLEVTQSSRFSMALTNFSLPQYSLQSGGFTLVVAQNGSAPVRQQFLVDEATLKSSIVLHNKLLAIQLNYLGTLWKLLSVHHYSNLI